MAVKSTAVTLTVAKSFEGICLQLLSSLFISGFRQLHHEVPGRGFLCAYEAVESVDDTF